MCGAECGNGAAASPAFRHDRGTIASLEKNLQVLSQRLKKASELQITSAQIIAKQAETLKQRENR